MSALPAEPYHMVHPGPVAADRIIVAGSRLVQASGRTGKTGQSLREAIAAFCSTHGVSSGNGTITQCRLAKTRFTTGGPAREGRAAYYTFIREFGPSVVPDGTFTFGIDPDGQPFVHCHAIIESPFLPHRSAGHLFPPDCLLNGAFDIAINGLPDLTLMQGPDDETLHSLFEPGASALEGQEAVFVRLRPNVDAVEGIEEACRMAGFSDARLLRSIGSLNAPVLHTLHGDDRPMTSVGMEVQAFEGRIRDGQASVTATLCDEDGAISAGQLVRGLAPVCVTAELVLVRR